MAKKDESESTPVNHIVKEGVVYSDVNGTLTRNYISVNGNRVYVLGVKPGDRLTEDQAKAQNAKKAAK